MTNILVIPDTQVKPDSDLDHLEWLGNYIAKKKPDHIVHLGDHWDMPSLCSYDFGKKSFEGRRYHKDVEAGHEGMVRLLTPLWKLQAKQRKNKKRVYEPEMTFIVGNHENRINRTTEVDPKLDGLVSMYDLDISSYGWYESPFLEVEVIEGVAFSHYFTSGIMGRPVSSSRMMLQKKAMSCVMGHVQTAEVSFQRRADGKQMTGLFAGIYYQHDEAYLTAQTNSDWRGVWMLHDVKEGEFALQQVSMDHLKKKYS